MDWQAIEQGLHNLQQHPALPYWVQAGGKPHCIGCFPAMVAAIRNLSGELMGLHCTWLQAAYAKPAGEDGLHLPTIGKLNMRHPVTGEPLAAKKMRSRYTGAIGGAAVQLYPCAEVLAVAEGIETALAVREVYGLPVWACLSAGGMKALHLPPTLRELLIFADNDHAGLSAAEALARRAKLAGLTVKLWHSHTPGNDVLDELNDIKAGRYRD